MQRTERETMKKTSLSALPFDVPRELERFVSGAQVYDSSCSPEARVYFLDKDGGYYLKTAKKGSLQKEAQMTAYFHSMGIGAEVLDVYGRDKVEEEMLEIIAAAEVFG